MIHADDIAPRQERHPVKAFQLALGAELRTLFAPVVEEPLPEELMAGLARLDRAPPDGARN